MSTTPQTKHTPGPWKWTAEDSSVLALYGPRGDEDHVLWSEICPACQKSGGRCTAPNDANARLIAAAPDLLAMLEEIIKDDERVISDLFKIGRFMPEPPLLKRARTVVDKAKETT